MNKQVFTLNNQELLQILTTERLDLIEKGKKKETKKVDFMIKAIEKATFTSLRVEGVRNNTNERQMVNCGSVVECLVKHYQKSYSDLWKEFNDLHDDTKNGFAKYEIKASLPNARNTALKEPKSVILVNTKGVYIIKKSVSLELPTDSQGRYYENEDYSQYEGVRLNARLTKLFGIVD